MLEKFVEISTWHVRPRSLQRWYRRHPKTVVGINVVALIGCIFYFWKQEQEMKMDEEYWRNNWPPRNPMYSNILTDQVEVEAGRASWWSPT